MSGPIEITAAPPSGSAFAGLVADLERLLGTAAEQMLDDSWLTVRLSRRTDVRRAVATARRRLVTAAGAARPRQPDHLPHPPRSLPVDVCVPASTREDRPVVVVVPLANPSVRLQRRCLASVARNFDSRTTAVLLCTSVGAPPPTDPLRGFDTVEVRHFGRFSLPTAYNNAVAVLRRGEAVPRAAGRVLVFMDDDAEIVGFQQDRIERRLAALRSGEFAIGSGHYYDTGPARDWFAATVGCAGTRRFAARVTKPFCHGGAAMMVHERRFPHEGLPEQGLGGISLAAIVSRSLEPEWRERAGGDRWYVDNDPALVVRHPLKADLVQWTATYVGYAHAWRTALDALSPAWREEWRRRLDAGRRSRLVALVDLAVAGGPESDLAVANILLTMYFKPLVVASVPLTDLIGAGLRVHGNLELDPEPGRC